MKKIYKPRVRESSVEAHLVKCMQAIGGDAIKFPQGEGLPDRLCCYKGKTWFVETKTTGGVLSPLQIERHAKLRKMGFTIYVPFTNDQVDIFITGVVLR